MTASLKPLRIKAAYSITELSRGTGIERRSLKRILEDAEVTFLSAGRVVYVPLSEIELKMPPLWEAIKAVHAFGDPDR